MRLPPKVASQIIEANKKLKSRPPAAAPKLKSNAFEKPLKRMEEFNFEV